MNLHNFSLEGNVAVVTGASKGLGQGIAVELARAGADVVSVHIEPDCSGTAAKIEALGRKCHGITYDLSGLEDAGPLAERVEKQYGPVSILVNNAGIQRRYPAAEFPLAEWDLMMQVQLRSVFLLCQAFGARMLSRGAGKIINMASMLSFSGGMYVPAYAAAKGGVAQLTKALANEKSGVRPPLIFERSNDVMLKSVERAVTRLEDALGFAFLVIMVVLVALQVVTRYLMPTPLPWTEEGARFCVVWLTFIGAAMGIRNHGHFAVEILVQKLPKPWIHYAQIALLTVVGIFSAVLLYNGMMILDIVKHQVSPAIEISMFWLYLSIPVGALLILIHIAALLREMLAASNPGNDADPKANSAAGRVE